MASRSGGLARMCLLAAMVAAVAGCVGMPSNGPTEELSASPQSSAPDGNLIGVVPSGPQSGEDPSQIVQGFLTASASYPTYAVAEEYLTSSAVKGWKPGFAVSVFSKLSVPKTATATKTSHGAQQTTVSVAGTVQASFDGSGQYVSAQSQGPTPGISYNFGLAKVDGQWRITNPPNYRMLPSYAFPLFYKAQDLYFFDPQNNVLVPDSVFVPLGATLSQLIDNLVGGLTHDPKTPWLVNATSTELPPGTTVQQVTTAGSTVTVNLVGHVAWTNPKLQRFAAQLVWTLTSSPGSPPTIQSVVLDLNGQPWTPASPPCSDGRSPDPELTTAAYACYNPYPSSPSSFYYIDRGQSWARCGSEALGLQGLIGPVVPVIGRTGTFSIQGCDSRDYVHEGYSVLPAAQPASLPASSMAAVSPDGKHLAVVSAARDAVYVGTLSGNAASFSDKPRLTGAGITALSWDHNGNLWVVQGGDIMMLSATGKGEVTVTFNGSASVSDLSVAPDGVRIAFIAQTAGQGPEIYLTAIGGGSQADGQLSSAGTHLSIRTYTSLGPNVGDPASLAWYDADDLIVLNNAAAGDSLWQVPVDGQQAQQLQVTPPGVTSITADGAANVLVAGLSGNNLAVSTSLEGPWYQLGEPGQSPAYPG